MVGGSEALERVRESWEFASTADRGAEQESPATKKMKGPH